MKEKQPVLIIYDDGSIDKVDLPSSAIRNIGQQLIALVDNAVMPGNLPPADLPTEDKQDD